MNQFDPAVHPRAGDGRFSLSPRTESRTLLSAGPSPANREALDSVAAALGIAVLEDGAFGPYIPLGDPTSDATPEGHLTEDEPVQWAVWYPTFERDAVAGLGADAHRAEIVAWFASVRDEAAPS